MLLQENFAEEHIRELQRTSRRDPVLLERAVYAFGLLEALAKVGMPFIFKGGTCLMLLMEHPRRLSTDIDIIAEPGTDLDKYLDRASEIFPFKAVEEQKRIGKNNIGTVLHRVSVRHAGAAKFCDDGIFHVSLVSGKPALIHLIGLKIPLPWHKERAVYGSRRRD